MSYHSDDVWCAIYCRLSEEDRDKQHNIDSRSIQNQKSMLTSYAESNGWKIYKIYSDDDYTGADRSRPAFNELMRDAEDHKFEIVICKSQSRFTRELEMVEKILHYQFPLWGIRFIGLADNADTANKGNKKSRQINGLVNEWYLEDLSDNIKSVLTDRRKKGYHIGAFCAYGYQKDPDVKGHLIPDPDAARVVHLIFELFTAGMGKMAIARYLNDEGIPNPTEYKYQKGIRMKTPDSKRSTMWQYFSISDILINEVYIGNMVQGKYGSVSYKTHQNKPKPNEEWIRVEHTHAPIIEKELWNKTQEIIKNHTKPGWDGQVGKFARKCRCMYCGYTMRSSKNKGRCYFRCSSRYIKSNMCQGGFIAQEELERMVLEELNIMIAEYLDKDRAEEQIVIDDEHKQKIDFIKNRILQYRKRIETAQRAIKMLYQDRSNDLITPEDFNRLSSSFKDEERECREKIQQLREQLDELVMQKEPEYSKRNLLEQYMNITKLTYETVNTLIDHIEVGRREGHYRKYKVPVVIHCNF